MTPTQHPWRLRSREGHGSRAGSGFVHSYCMMLLASFVALSTTVLEIEAKLRSQVSRRFHSRHSLPSVACTFRFCRGEISNATAPPRPRHSTDQLEISHTWSRHTLDTHHTPSAHATRVAVAPNCTRGVRRRSSLSSIQYAHGTVTHSSQDTPAQQMRTTAQHHRKRKRCPRRACAR